MDESHNRGQGQLVLCQYPQEMPSTLSRDIFLFSLHDQDFLAKCLS